MGTARKDITISPIALVRRRLNGVRTVSSGEVNRSIPQAEFSETCRRYQREAAGQLSSMPEVVNGLWKSEGFATTFGKYRLPDNTLNDPRIPRESLGIVHVGYGAASNEHAHFDTVKLRETFETKCQPNYSGFAIEGTGSTLRIYEPGFFKFMCGVLGRIPRNAPPGPVLSLRPPRVVVGSLGPRLFSRSRAVELPDFPRAAAARRNPLGAARREPSGSDLILPRCRHAAPAKCSASRKGWRCWCAATTRRKCSEGGRVRRTLLSSTARRRESPTLPTAGGRRSAPAETLADARSDRHPGALLAAGLNFFQEGALV